MCSRSKLLVKLATDNSIARKEEIEHNHVRHEINVVSHNDNKEKASEEISYQEKVLHYLKSLENDSYGIDANDFEKPLADTDFGINISSKVSPRRPECSVPYLDISDESPTFKEGLSALTSVKKNLFGEHSISPERKMNIIQNIPMKPLKLKNVLEDIESVTSESFSSINDNAFDVDYRIPSTSSSNSDKECLAKYSAPVTEMLENAETHEGTGSTMQQVSSVILPDKLSSKTKKNRIPIKGLPQDHLNNKVFCPLCYEEVGHFARHLERNHADDAAVQKILRMPRSSSERRAATMALRKKGNFLLKNEKDKFGGLRLNDEMHLHEEEYYPCVNCLAFYKKTYLWRHRKICKANPNKDFKESNKHVTNAQTFMVTTGILGNFLNKSKIKTDVFTIMRADKISYTAKSDPLICLYGESYLNKHKRKQMNIVASNRMREMARLKIAIMEASVITSLIDVLKPCHYELIVASAKVVSGYDAQNKAFKASSLALHFGTNLKFMCDVAKKAILTNNPLFNYEEEERKCTLKQITLVKDIISNHWCNDVSSLANKVLNEYKVKNPKILPVTKDVRALNEFIKNKAQEAYINLEKNLKSAPDYKVLIECVLVQVLIFNRKRVGEVQFLEIKSYKADTSSIGQNELLHALTDFEKAMSSTFKRVVVFGKGSRPVPLLFTKQMQKFMEMILRVREETDIVPKTNPYMFANPGCADRWISGPSVIRKYAHMCGAKNPETLTSTRFRKQIATILQIMNFEADEMEQIATFMGHTEKTHKEFYRMSEDIYQTAKVAKVLLLLNEGKGKEFKGKSLAEIEVSEDLLGLDNEEDTEENMEMEVEIPSSHNEIQESIDSQIAQEETETKDDEDSGSVLFKPKKGKKNVGTKKLQRHTWSQEEKQNVLTYFKNHVRSKKAPRKNECLDFISKHRNFDNSDWVRIKTFVYNTYRQK